MPSPRTISYFDLAIDLARTRAEDLLRAQAAWHPGQSPLHPSRPPELQALLDAARAAADYLRRMADHEPPRGQYEDLMLGRDLVEAIAAVEAMPQSGVQS